jgi:RNA polymerase sigma-70 factor (ECF subfamily)
MTGSATSSHPLTNAFEQYTRPILRYVRSMVHDPAEADDITQETFLRAHRNLATLQDQAKLSPWLYRIATNLCYDRFRQTSSRPRPQSLGEVADASSQAELADDTAPRLDQVIEQKEMSACVQEYLDSLSDSYRAVILLHDMQGLNNPEIAEMLGCSLATVKIRLHRARARLRAKLAKGCDFSQDKRGVLVCDPKPSTPKEDPQ